MNITKEAILKERRKKQEKKQIVVHQQKSNEKIYVILERSILLLSIFGVVLYFTIPKIIS